jgi:glycosyltransferase involved in cell wall biosynthesis
MKIAVVAPVWYPLPPRGYSAIERFLTYLVDALVDAGADITLYASGDSHTAAPLRPLCPKSLATADVSQQMQSYAALCRRVQDEADEFDVICFFNDFLDHIPELMPLDGKMLSLVSGWGEPSKYERVKPYRQTRCISVTDAQRRCAPWLNWIETIHLGLPQTLFQPQLRHDGYLAYLGRINPTKRLDRAIRLAHLTGRQLKIIGPWATPGVDADFRDNLVAPMIRSGQIEFVGEVNEERKGELLGAAEAFIFPGDGPETFGIAMIEAMACGTPVVGWNRWSMPEVISHGVSGFVVESLPAAVDAINRIGTLDRARVRREFERLYTAELMAARYLRLFERSCRPS